MASPASNNQRVIVVGGGLAGLAAAARLAEKGIQVDLFSLVPVKRSHSVCAQGGINSCDEVVRQEGFSEWIHFDETLFGGDFLADQPPVYEMTHWAPKIIDLLDRMGVSFNRTNEGYHDLRAFGGSLFKRTHFAGATTGQQLLYVLDEQVRRAEVEGKVTKYEYWEFLWPVIDEIDGVRRCVGIVAQDLRTMQIRSFRASAVAIATGGVGFIFGKSTNSVSCTGSAASRCYQAGAWYANGEMIQVHPTAIPGADKCRLMSESARGEGGRIWVPRTKGDQRDPRQIPEAERMYFLEERYPKYGNLVPRDIASRELFDVCVNDGMGVGGENMVYLDLTHIPREELDRKLRGILEIYEKFVGEDPHVVPMKIFPAVHYSMGGMWTTFTSEERPADAIMDKDCGLDRIVGMKLGASNTMSTNILGLYALGEVNFAYHGATRLGANALLSCIFDGLFAGVGIANYANEEAPDVASLAARPFDEIVKQEESKVDVLRANTKVGACEDANNPYIIARELGVEMTASCTVVRTGDRMDQSMDKIRQLSERCESLVVADPSTWTNQNLMFTRSLIDMVKLAEVILVGSQKRQESRGSHYRPDFPDRNDDNFWKTTIAKYDAVSKRPVISYRKVIAPMVKPRPRVYGKEPERAPADNKPTQPTQEPAPARG